MFSNYGHGKRKAGRCRKKPSHNKNEFKASAHIAF